MINLEVFKTEWEKIENKLFEINDLPRLYGSGNSHINVEIDLENKVFCVTSETYYSGCGTDTFNCEVLFDEINQPIEYFKEKFQKKIDEHEKEKQLNLKLAEEKRNELELKELERLQKKFNFPSK